MRRKSFITAAAAAATAAAAIATVSASGQSSTTASPATIQLIEKKTSFKLVDHGRKGESAGDYGLVSGELLSTDRKRVGRFLGTCFVFKPSAGQTQCSFALSLPDGQIITQAGYGSGFNGSKTVHEAVVGGTRAYKDARGEVVSEETGETTGTLAIQLD